MKFPQENPKNILESEPKITKDEMSLEGKLEKITRTERKSGEPEISVDIFHSLHETAEDIESLEEQLADADIYVPEVFGWSSVDSGQYVAIAEGRKSPDEIIRSLEITTPDMYPPHDTRKKEFEVLYNSHKPIIIIDVPIDHPLKAKFDRLDQSLSLGGNFETDLESYKQFLETLAKLQKEREEFILSQFKEKIKEVIQATPSLHEKDKVKVLMSLGSIHTVIGHTFKKEGVETKTRFNSMPYFFNFENEVIRRFMFGKEVNNELMAKALLESEIYGHFQLSPEENSMHVQQVLRKVVDSFSLDEIKRTMEKLKEDSDPTDLFIAIARGKEFDPELKDKFEKLFGNE